MPTTFSDLGVAADVIDLLSRQGIAEPFPIQTATLADALAGRDVCGRAPTGSGKTLAFGIPLASRVAKARPGRPRALVLVPTRELGAQVAKELAPLAALRGRTVTVFYGGVGYGPQLAALRKGPDIAVACPGRLADLVARRAIRLDDVDHVVVD
ncbi:MAG: DEAD/DEAH box helicase, partial [Actinomycetota bacterium]|nr:DEAD/DEAH box helicase [Actinomycetota bacterium]